MLYLKHGLMQFDGRPYLPAIYASGHNLILRASRQVEKSTFLCNTILFEAVRRPGSSLLLVCPRQEQARMLFRDRLQPAVLDSPLVRRMLLGRRSSRLQFSHSHFANGSSLFLRAAFRSADGVRGISADILLVDEFQDIASGDLPVLQETLSHSPHARTILTGTPKLIDNQLEAMFRQSTANEWTIDCTGCGLAVILDERALGPTGIRCPSCQANLDTTTGHWVPRNPTATWGDGFWVNHLMVPWVNFDEVLERQRIYDLARFKNEVLGLSTTLGEHVVTRAELEACCTDRPMANSAGDIPAWAAPHVVIGIDWGGGGTSCTVMVVGYMNRDYAFEVCHFSRFRADEDPNRVLDCVAEGCRKFGARWIAADGGGNGHVQNRLLLDRLNYHPQNLYAILYSMSDQPPRPDGDLWKWVVHRSATIGVLFSRVKKRLIRFPRVEECGTFIDEFACEVAEYDDVNRTVRYSHPTNQQDDALHATNYALLLSVELWNAEQGE